MRLTNTTVIRNQGGIKNTGNMKIDSSYITGNELYPPNLINPNPCAGGIYNSGNLEIVNTEIANSTISKGEFVVRFLAGGILKLPDQPLNLIQNILSRVLNRLLLFLNLPIFFQIKHFIENKLPDFFQSRDFGIIHSLRYRQRTIKSPKSQR